jgi:hypothetical protein
MYITQNIFHHNYFENQFLHGTWDLSLRQMSDAQLRPSIFQITKSMIRNIVELDLANRLLSKQIDTVFMGHNVYSYKTSIALFIKNNVKVFYHYNCAFLKKNKDGTPHRSSKFYPWSIPR